MHFSFSNPKSNHFPLLITVLIGFMLGLSCLPTVSHAESWLDTRSSDHLNVLGMVPLEGETLKDRIVFIFDAPILLPENKDGSSFPPISIQPEAGMNYEIRANQMIVNVENVTDEQVYRIVLNPQLQSKDGKPLNPAHRVTVLASSNFYFKRFWTIEETPQSVVFGLLFSIPVSLSDLEKHLEVKDTEDERIAWDLEQGADNKLFRLKIASEQNWPISLNIQKELKDQTGYFKLPNDIKKVYPAEKFVLLQKLEWGDYKPDEQTISIKFSRLVDAADLKEHLSIQDKHSNNALDFEIQSDGVRSDHIISLKVPDPENALIGIEIKKGLPGDKGTKLYEDEIRILERRAHPQRELQIRYHYWSNQQKDGMAFRIYLNQSIQPYCSLEELRDHVEVSPELHNMQVNFDSSRRIEITGDWRPNETYTVTFKEGLPFYESTTLSRPLQRHATMNYTYEWGSFGQEEKYYFPKRTGISLPFYSRFVEKADITLYRLFPSNLAVSMRDLNNGEGSTQFNHSWCEPVANKSITISGENYKLSETAINLDELVPDNRRGVFGLEARFNGRYATKIILYTDIGNIAHWRNQEFTIFSHDLFSLTPLSGAKVTVYSHKNQILGSTLTDQQGMAHLKEFNTNLGSPLVAVVEHGNDFTFLKLDRREEGTDAMKASMPHYNKDAYDAFLYADRDLYRPGETVHLRWIVRTNYGDALNDVPLMLRINKPNGKELLSQLTTLSNLGAGGLDIDTLKEYPTGEYEAQLLVPGSNNRLGSYSFRLEEFVPHRIKADVQLDETRWKAGEEYTITLQANHLFGAPAAERKVEAKIYFEQSSLTFENWKGYHFGNDSDYVPESVSLGEAKTDEEGKATFKYTYAPNPKVTFPLKAIVIGRVFELGGRAVTTRKDAMLLPSDILLGLTAESMDNKAGIKVHAAAIQPDESPADIETVKVTLEKQTWNYYVRRYYSHNQPSWTQSFIPVETREISLNEGRASTEFDISGYGYYRVKVHSDDTPQYSTLSFYSYGYRCERVKGARPSLIKLSLDQSSYTVGDQATVRIESPFDGRGIVVVQGEEIQRMYSIQIDNNVGTLQIPLEKEDYPNIWVEATVIHAVKQDRAQVYPFSSFAMTHIPVKNPERELEVKITDKPEEIRPEQTYEFNIAVRDHEGNPITAELTLAAVDEGIHLISNYQSPKPYEWFSRPRQPDFRRAHYYDHVAYDFDKMKPGGDMAEAMAKRTSSDLEDWIKPVALWSGTVTTDENGNAAVEIDIPEFTGQLRLDVVAYSERAAGSASEKMFVRRKHALRTNMPRFMLPEDQAECRAVLFNNTDEACRIDLHWSAGGALLAATGEIQLQLPAQSEKSAFAKIMADKLSGQGILKWKAEVYDKDGTLIETIEESAPMPVEHPAAYQSAHEFQVLKPGETLKVGNDQFINDRRSEITLTVGSNPALQLQDALSYVIGYPYGCVEQTTSRLMPLYLLRQNAALMKASFEEADSLFNYIQTGIDRLFTMQTASGGLGFWPGSRDPYAYGSVYAFHFLTLVKNDRQLNVPEKYYNALANYIKQQVSEDNNRHRSNLYLRAYAIFTLALSGDIESIRQINRFDSITVPRAARYLLAAALMHTTKDLDRVSLYLSDMPSEPYLASEQDGTLNSDIRNTAVELIVLNQTGVNPERRTELAQKLTTYLKNHRIRAHSTTQQTAFIVTALGDYLSDFMENVDKAKASIIYSNNATSGDLQLEGNDLVSKTIDGPNASFTIANEGESNLIVNITRRGIPKEIKNEPVSNGLTIEREFLSNKGDSLQERTFTQSESYIIGLQIECDQRAKNVIVADLLPAGFEVVNPRLEVDALPTSNLKGAVTPAYLDIRDDRVILAFDNLDQGTHHFYYVVRAVTPGHYQHPPVQAECMYDPSVNGSSAAGKIKIHE